MSLVGKLQGNGHQCCGRVCMEDSSGEWHLTRSGSPGFLEEVTFDCPLKAKVVVCQIERWEGHSRQRSQFVQNLKESGFLAPVSAFTPRGRFVAQTSDPGPSDLC